LRRRRKSVKEEEKIKKEKKKYRKGEGEGGGLFPTNLFPSPCKIFNSNIFDMFSFFF